MSDMTPDNDCIEDFAFVALCLILCIFGASVALAWVIWS